VNDPGSVVVGRSFWKMSGSGNDFVFFDAREVPAGALMDAPFIRLLCDRRRGVGADGVVIIKSGAGADFRMVYFNADGSRASFCGNAALCSSRLAIQIGASRPTGFRFLSDVGLIEGRVRDGLPEIDLPTVDTVVPTIPVVPEPGERRVGFALAGVPHAVILCDDAERAPLEDRGPSVRRDPQFAEGANVDFVSPMAGGWRMRTFERGVEAETLACGTGAVATSILLTAWGETSGPETRIVTSSGLPLHVRLSRLGRSWTPSLRGNAQVTFEGTLRELPATESRQ
jgi:diaminopimelate epimerase